MASSSPGSRSLRGERPRTAASTHLRSRDLLLQRPVVVLPHGGVEGELPPDVLAHISRGHLVLSGDGAALASLWFRRHGPRGETRCWAHNDPLDPVEPVDPVDPVEPVEPVDPVEPSAQCATTTASRRRPASPEPPRIQL